MKKIIIVISTAFIYSFSMAEADSGSQCKALIAKVSQGENLSAIVQMCNDQFNSGITSENLYNYLKNLKVSDLNPAIDSCNGENIIQIGKDLPSYKQSYERYKKLDAEASEQVKQGFKSTCAEIAGATVGGKSPAMYEAYKARAGAYLAIAKAAEIKSEITEKVIAQDKSDFIINASNLSAVAGIDVNDKGVITLNVNELVGDSEGFLPPNSMIKLIPALQSGQVEWTCKNAEGSNLTNDMLPSSCR